MYTCIVCGANVDAGELIGDICEDCYAENQKRIAMNESIEMMLNIDVIAAQMNLEEFLSS